MGDKTIKAVVEVKVNDQWLMCYEGGGVYDTSLTEANVEKDADRYHWYVKNCAMTHPICTTDFALIGAKGMLSTPVVFDTKEVVEPSFLVCSGINFGDDWIYQLQLIDFEKYADDMQRYYDKVADPKDILSTIVPYNGVVERFKEALKNAARVNAVGENEVRLVMKYDDDEGEHLEEAPKAELNSSARVRRNHKDTVTNRRRNYGSISKGSYVERFW